MDVVHENHDEVVRARFSSLSNSIQREIGRASASCRVGMKEPNCRVSVGYAESAMAHLNPSNSAKYLKRDDRILMRSVSAGY